MSIIVKNNGVVIETLQRVPDGELGAISIQLTHPPELVVLPPDFANVFSGWLYDLCKRTPEQYVCVQGILIEKEHIQQYKGMHNA